MRNRYSAVAVAILRNGYDVIFPQCVPRFFYEIRQSDGEYHVDYGELVEIETGNRIPIWRTFVFRKRKQLYLSRQLRFQNKMRFANRLDILKAVASTNTKPEVVFRAVAAAILRNGYDVIFPKWVL